METPSAGPHRFSRCPLLREIATAAFSLAPQVDADPASRGARASTGHAISSTGSGRRGGRRPASWPSRCTPASAGCRTGSSTSRRSTRRWSSGRGCSFARVRTSSTGIEALRNEQLNPCDSLGNSLDAPAKPGCYFLVRRPALGTDIPDRSRTQLGHAALLKRKSYTVNPTFSPGNIARPALVEFAASQVHLRDFQRSQDLDLSRRWSGSLHRTLARPMQPQGCRADAPPPLSAWG